MTKDEIIEKLKSIKNVWNIKLDNSDTKNIVEYYRSRIEDISMEIEKIEKMEFTHR